ncbi:hypothetical protein CH254_10835 [Rhodococcus sp. 06-412-2C]|uniref:hypothetical protein n=1 Tax=unclassified Rhodococcus (in: high G+C Gram-positive bacteria) TaxID=192944 RepID=UPI000B9BFBA8|nr:MULTISPECIES: hypothetical protein [unclassified Rhodococcus (in: high G+C Gram-positive bacteria)]OZC89079.1 hypothetical protein CH254_10835 [Rhodococcus sp. 06-412-2C]OZC99738.1 hypothetical protein CH279_08000 [Rhodococcus sp. 06-412-2B]
MSTPEQGYRRTRIATAAMAALGVAVFGGSATLAYLDTHEPASAATVTEAQNDDTAGGSATAPSFGSTPRVTTPSPSSGSTSSGSTSGSGTTHARTHGS